MSTADMVDLNRFGVFVTQAAQKPVGKALVEQKHHAESWNNLCSRSAADAAAQMSSSSKFGEAGEGSPHR